jgi:lipoprotein-anchoring transpeptidase ErfK/SrfK
MPANPFGALLPEALQQPAEPQDDTTNGGLVSPTLRRQVVSYQTREPPGTIIIDTAHTFLYLTLGNGTAIRYGIGVGRSGFTWSGIETISRKTEWPDWIPPAEICRAGSVAAREIRSVRARSISAIPPTASTAPTPRNRSARVQRLHPLAQRGRDRPLRRRRRRHQGRGAGERSA